MQQSNLGADTFVHAERLIKEDIFKKITNFCPQQWIQLLAAMDAVNMMSFNLHEGPLKGKVENSPC